MNDQIISLIRDHHFARCTPDEIRELPDNGVFVFGTNPEGKHNSYAAKLAVKNFGAEEAIGEGFRGRSYAIPIHKHHTDKMCAAVDRFIYFVKKNPELDFYVLPVGCGKAGMDPSFVALMFRRAIGLPNIWLPEVFLEHLIEYYSIGVEISEDCQTLIRFPMHNSIEYKVPYGIRVLGRESFCGCCCEVILPASLKRIEDYAFCDMGGFDSFIVIPSSVKWISDKAFECEYVSPGMLVEYKSYPYEYARQHKIRYKCTDFDEEKFLEQQRISRANDNAANHGLWHYIDSMLRIDIYNRSMSDGRIEALPKGQIAIARDYGFVLNDDGHLTLFGRNDDFRQIVTSCRIVKVAASFVGYMALTENGHIITAGPAREFDRHCDIERLSDVLDVVSCEGHTVALFKNGTVVSIDEPGGWEGVPRHNSIVQKWKNIKQVAVGFSNIMGLTSDGRVLYHSEDGHTDCHYYDGLNNVIQIDCYSHYYGNDSSMVLRSNGTVVSDTFEGVDKWKDIVQISVGADIAIGLKNDGTVEVVDYRESRLDVLKWRDLVSVECKFFGVIGITKNGEILSIFS